MKLRVRHLSSAALVLVAVLTAPASSQQPTFRGATDLVTFGVTVADRRGNLVADLIASDFEVVEEGVRQSIHVFASGGVAASSPALHVGLLFDTSASMGEHIQLSRSAAIKFLNTLRDARDMTLVDFDTEVRVARYGQADFPRLIERIRARKPAGYTALYDALGVYLDGAADDDGRTVLVVYTDGGDTTSATGFSGVLELVRASDVTIHVVGFLEPLRSSVRTEQRVRLQQLADETGGHAIFPLSMTDIERAYIRIAEQVRAQYTLGYVSSHDTADGKWRRVRISVRKPGASGLKVYTRKGYYAPYKQVAGDR